MSGFNKDKADLNATINDLRAQVQKLTSERDNLKTQPVTGTPASSDSKALNDQIEALRNEKVALEASLAEANSQGAAETPNQSVLVRFQFFLNFLIFNKLEGFVAARARCSPRRKGDVGHSILDRYYLRSY
jgi:hypothetical protein